MPGRLAPISEDPIRSIALVRAAVEARAGPDDPLEERVAYVEREIRSGRFRGGLWIRDGRAVGLAWWDPPGVRGTHLRLVYLEPDVVSPASYHEFLDSVERSAGPLVTAPPLAGLSGEEETEVLGGLGFAPFARFEMRLPSGMPSPDRQAPPGFVLRPLRPEDQGAVARVHAAAFRDRFDRYLFLEDPDPERDAEKVVASLLHGQWGEYLPWASFAAETAGNVIGVTIVLRAPGRALIADVSVDPAHQGHGIGRALVCACVNELRDRGEPTIALVVTEGNRRAIHLYESLGFVRAFAPDRRWYRTRLIPVSPDAG
ncbi:MAG TPA: GNAT family N-acetyltransferase [Thermoplasmata archaeon]|nr:GNAT family N-acetyltransferase [Thermoplasmata archaeon]